MTFVVRHDILYEIRRYLSDEREVGLNGLVLIPNSTPIILCKLEIRAACRTT